MTTFEIGTLAVSSMAAILFILQLWMINRTVKLDYERHRNQATIEFAGKEFRKARELLQQNHGTQKLTEEEFEKLKNNADQMASINSAFGTLEHIAVALNAGVYDKTIFFKMFGRTCIEIFNNYYLYIEYRRSNHGKTTYSQFEKLVKDNSIKGAVKH
ncbi:MAG: hypothetical protein COA84_04990 [Robiginitomaculum sp.]|nr:MAG: hypothetical protein COA84_04990 [Robiginitomaculum sp.]